MRRRWLIYGATCALLALTGAGGRASSGTPITDTTGHPVLQRLFASQQVVPHQLVAIRRLEARNDHFDTDAWMEVRTEADGKGFHYQILGEGGSGYIRSRVFKSALQTEQKMWANGDPDRAAFTPDNYQFEDRGAEPSGLVWLGVTPKRKDILLVNGSIFVSPDDGELVRIEGSLAKTPSFWTKRVDIVRLYERVAGVRLPVWMESTAAIRIAGKSTYTTSYHYISVNDQPVVSQ
jgi:hypothetical protein